MGIMLGGTTLFGLGDIANSVHCLIQELENGNEIKQDDWNMIYYFLETSREDYNQEDIKWESS